MALLCSLAMMATSAIATSAIAAPTDPEALEPGDLVFSLQRLSVGDEPAEFTSTLPAGGKAEFLASVMNVSSFDSKTTATNLTLRYQLPDSMQLSGVSTPDCTKIDAQTVSCTIAKLAPLDSVEFGFAASVDANASGDDEIATIVMQGNTVLNRYGTDFRFINWHSDVAVSQKPQQVYTGAIGGAGPQAWDVVVTNHSNEVAARVDVQGYLSDNLTDGNLVDANHWSGQIAPGVRCSTTYQSGQRPAWNCTITNLGAHKSVTLPFKIDIDGVPCPGSDVTHEVWVGPYVNDPNPANNYASATVAVENNVNLDECPVPIRELSRVGGKNRYDTANQLSFFFGPEPAVVYLASGQAYPDALAASAAGGFNNAPVLLTEAKRLPGDVKNQLQQLKPHRVVIVGGPGAISPQVENAVKAALPSTPVDRYGGNNRFETAAMLAENTYPSVSRIYIASGMDFPDALAAAAAAGARGGPVLLSLRDELPLASAKVVRDFNAPNIVIVGGEGVISRKVARQVEAASYGATPIRYAGANRLETARMVATGEFWRFPTIAVIANAFDYPDALVGAAVAGMNRGPVLLTPPDRLSEDAKNALVELIPTTGIVVGGEAVISDVVMQQIRNATGMQEPQPGVG